MQSVYLSVIFHEKHQKDATCRRGGFKKIKGFQKSFRNTATYQKLWGEVPSTPPASLSLNVPRWGV